jgi:hypothetical protein
MIKFTKQSSNSSLLSQTVYGRTPNFNILSKKCIKLAKKTSGANFLVLKLVWYKFRIHSYSKFWVSAIEAFRKTTFKEVLSSKILGFQTKTSGFLNRNFGFFEPKLWVFEPKLRVFENRNFVFLKTEV